MQAGLNFWKNNGSNILLDADNLFWAITQGNNDSDAFIPKNVLNLYTKVKEKLDIEINNFRFSQDLTAIYIDPTDKCNSHCPYCYIPAEIRQKGRSMSKEELEFILKKIALFFKHKERKPVIVFHASEPLLVKEIIFEAITKHNKVFKFGIQTNAILLEKKDVKFLKKYRIGVGISLDSNIPSVNNRLRPVRKRKGNFLYAVRAIEWFNGYPGLNVITTVTEHNVRNLPELVRFLHLRKVPCVLFNPVRLTQRNSRILKPDTKLLIKYFLRAVDIARELSEKTKQKIIIGNFTNIILGIIAPTARRLMCDISPCGGGRCFLTITAQGEMIPCGEFIGLKGFSGGNIFKNSIKSAMQSKPFKRIRERFAEKITECKDCFYRNICGAPCPAELHALGNMYNKSIFCEFYKEIIAYAFKIIAEGKEKSQLRQEGLMNLKYAYKL